MAILFFKGTKPVVLKVNYVPVFYLVVHLKAQEYVR
jgi:hypothetical protein